VCVCVCVCVCKQNKKVLVRPENPTGSVAKLREKYPNLCARSVS
jgi:hypothetical protein